MYGPFNPSPWYDPDIKRLFSTRYERGRLPEDLGQTRPGVDRTKREIRRNRHWDQIFLVRRVGRGDLWDLVSSGEVSVRRDPYQFQGRIRVIKLPNPK